MLPRESPKSLRFAGNHGWRSFCLGITAPLGGTPQSLRLETVFSRELLASLRAFTEWGNNIRLPASWQPLLSILRSGLRPTGGGCWPLRHASEGIAKVAPLRRESWVAILLPRNHGSAGWDSTVASPGNSLLLRAAGFLACFYRMGEQVKVANELATFDFHSALRAASYWGWLLAAAPCFRGNRQSRSASQGIKGGDSFASESRLRWVGLHSRSAWKQSSPASCWLPCVLLENAEGKIFFFGALLFGGFTVCVLH
ncbi:hypothetical protein EDM59_10665 [Brevibacillus nitrificans]|uniref:Uncharacterized protein n=2 Tax=Brevibacillus nitrificans TaxID=651560 RepID=A0A3M8DGZ4_9BACL|nr:hypothetical protein EDM59_10665 [Brevibacillus nitrificans]